MVRLMDKVLDELPYPFFATREVMNLVGGSKDRRYGIIKRALATGEILHLRRGLYTLAPRPNVPTVNPLVLAQPIYGPSYISLESALSYHHWIPEGVYAVTSVCLKKATRFETALGLFTYDRVPQDIFYTEVERISSADAPSFLMASPLKALADYVYLYKKDWTGQEPVQESLRMDPEVWDHVTGPHLDILMQNYRSRRVRQFLAGLKKDLSL